QVGSWLPDADAGLPGVPVEDEGQSHHLTGLGDLRAEAEADRLAEVEAAADRPVDRAGLEAGGARGGESRHVEDARRASGQDRSAVSDPGRGQPSRASSHAGPTVGPALATRAARSRSAVTTVTRCPASATR